MKQVVQLFAVVFLIVVLLGQTLGFNMTMQLAYGAISIMALLISFTFLYLWFERATPLALGMSLSWAGTGLTIGWWWLMRVLGDPAWEIEAAVLGVFLSLLISGAVLHFAVIQGSFGLRGLAFLWPVLAGFVMSLGVLMLL